MPPDAGSIRTLLIVAGSGRSGTSTVSGALQRLGFHVPQPEVPADETNPRGFYEPQWVVEFHKRLLRSIPVRTIDARPVAVGETEALARDPELTGELTRWLTEHRDHENLLIKDPRTFWFHQLWRQAANDLGMEMVFLTMLRHPVEVARSRDSAYLSGRDPDERRARETANVAAWCQAVLVTESSTRRDRRGFVRHADLMTDWRAAVSGFREQTGAPLEDPYGSGAGAAAVDSFIDHSLYRSRSTWSDVRVHQPLQDLAEEVWRSVNVLVDEPGDAKASASLDALRQDYAELYRSAVDLTLDNTVAAVARERRRLKEQRLAKERQVSELRRRNKRLREQLTALGREPARRWTWWTRSPRRVLDRLRSGGSV